MTYRVEHGVKTKNKKKSWLLLFPVFFLIGGTYVLLNSLAPQLPVLDTRAQDATAQKLVKKEPGTDGDRLYIPQLNVDVAIVTGVNDDTLERGAWHRNPQNGDPTKGGNFVLSAHRFQLGLTPIETRAKSPFYHLDKLLEGDELFVDYGDQRYVYKVTRKYKVPQDALSIEAKTDEAKLTLYSCDLRGPEAGREVIEAKPVGTVAWNSGSPVIQPSVN